MSVIWPEMDFLAAELTKSCHLSNFCQNVQEKLHIENVVFYERR